MILSCENLGKKIQGSRKSPKFTGKEKHLKTFFFLQDPGRNMPSYHQGFPTLVLSFVPSDFHQKKLGRILQRTVFGSFTNPFFYLATNLYLGNFTQVYQGAVLPISSKNDPGKYQRSVPSKVGLGNLGNLGTLDRAKPEREAKKKKRPEMSRRPAAMS